MSVPRRIDLAAFLVAGVGTALLAADQGGFFERSWPWAGLGLGAAGALVLLSSVGLRMSAAALTLVAATAGLCAWTALSWFWSSEPPTSLHEALRTPIYLAAAVTFVTLAAADGSLGLIVGVAAGATGVAGYSLVERYLHGVHEADQQLRLLERPLGYANALGALCGIGVIVVATLGVRARRNLGATAVSAAAAAVLLTALALTGSRGAWLAVACGALIAVAARAGGGRLAAPVAFSVALLLSGLFALTAFGTPERLQARGDYWHASWHVAARHPVVGTGAGTFDLAWAAYGDVVRWGGAVDAHSLYLEMLAELGLVGLVLVLGLTVPVVAALRAARPSATATAALGAAVTYLVHAGLDWDWEMPAVTVAGVACLAATIDGREPAEPMRPRVRTTLLAVEIGLVFGYLLYLTLHRL